MDRYKHQLGLFARTSENSLDSPKKAGIGQRWALEVTSLSDSRCWGYYYSFYPQVNAIPRIQDQYFLYTLGSTLANKGL